MSNSSLESDVKVPAPLHLPFGKLFFGFKITAYKPPPSSTSAGSPVVAAPVSLDILFVVFVLG
jgi:ubiquitin fusion degradation protein 1